MLRKFYESIDEWFFPERYIDKKDGQFPAENDFVIFKTIQDMCAGKATIEDLHRAVLTGGNEALEKTISIENITGPEEQWVWGVNHSTYKGKSLTPLHYAFLTGREDAFSLLLADGANIDKEFFIQCTSMSQEQSEASKITGTLQSFMLRYNAYTLLDPFMARGVRHAYFLALLQRKEVAKLMDVLMFEIRMNHKEKSGLLNLVRGSSWQSDPLPEYKGTSDYNARTMFRTIPSVETIQHAVGEMDTSYTQALTEIVSKLNELQLDAEHGEGYFITYTDEAIKVVLKSIDQFIVCFAGLRQHLDVSLTHAGYQWAVLETLHNDYRDFARHQQKKDYLDGIAVKINLSCYWFEKDDDDLESDPRRLLTTIVSLASGCVNEIDTDLYRETLLEFVRDQLLGYANGLQDANLRLVADRLAVLQMPVSASRLTQELKLVVKSLDLSETLPPQKAQTKKSLCRQKAVSISDAYMANSVFGRKRPEGDQDVLYDYMPKYRP